MILTRTAYLELTPETATTLWYIGRCCNRVWNALVEDRQAALRDGRKANYYSQKRLLPGMKKGDPRLKDPSSQVLQEVVKTLDGSYRSFFAKRKNGDTEANPPGFRNGRRFFTQNYPQRGTSFEIEGPTLNIAFGRTHKDWLAMTLPEGDYSGVKTVRVGFDDLAKRFVAWMSVEVPEAQKKSDGYWIYFDPGCKNTLTGITTEGRFVEYDINPLRNMNMSTYRLLDKLSSRRDTKKKGSLAWRRLNKRIAALWRKVAGRTKSYLHTLANQILIQHPAARGFKIGDWDKQATLADTPFPFVNRRINRAVQNNNPVRKLVEMLSYKAQLLTGQSVDEFDERGTTRTCVACGHVHSQGISPSKRHFVCERCQFSFPRDHHSGLNFLKRFKPAVWHGLRGAIPVSSARTTIAPFSFKPQTSEKLFFPGGISTTGCTVSI